MKAAERVLGLISAISCELDYELDKDTIKVAMYAKNDIYMGCNWQIHWLDKYNLSKLIYQVSTSGWILVIITAGLYHHDVG